MNDGIEIPSLEQIEQMERQRAQAVEALQISDDYRFVKCQRCSNAIPIVGKLPHQHNNDRIANVMQCNTELHYFLFVAASVDSLLPLVSFSTFSR